MLERAGLVVISHDAQRRPRKLAAEPEAVGWLERYRKVWERNYERLDALLEELKPKPEARKRQRQRQRQRQKN